MKKEIVAPGIVKFDINKNLFNKVLNELKLINENAWNSSGVISELINNEDASRSIRNSDTIHFEEYFPDLNKKLDFELNNILFEYRINYFDCEVNINSKENFSALRYKKGGYYKIHTDTSSFMYRTVSCLIYLNPLEYEGGETYFKYFDLNYKPKEPCVLIFPSNYIYAHSAMPIISGTKYVLTNWYNDLLPIDDTGHSYKNISILNKKNLIEIDGERYFKIPKRTHNDK